MTITKIQAKTNVKRRPNLWFERLMAILVTINFALVLFDLSYIPLRNFWLHGDFRFGKLEIGPIETEGYHVEVLSPALSGWITQYDQIKGIVPHRDTQDYLILVNQVNRQFAVTNQIDSPTVRVLLADLRTRSLEMIDENPFAIADKTGTLEQIKNRIRDYLPNSEDSAKIAFQEFWSVDYLQSDTKAKLNWFNRQIVPLIETNYFRPFGENGEFVDYFGLIDFPFFVLFLVEFLLRTWYISRSRAGVSWLDAMLWRWYDWFLLIPLWRILRIIPVTIRLNQARLINLNRVQKQVSQGFVAGIAEDVTQVVVLRVINQLENAISTGELAKIIAPKSGYAYIDINNTNEAAEIIHLLSTTLVDRVLPKIKPDIEAILQYSIEKTVQQTTPYQNLKFIPGIDTLQHNLIEQAVNRTYDTLLHSLQNIVESDEVFDQLLAHLWENLTTTLTTEISAQQNISRIEYLLGAALEEIKINYVQRMQPEDIEALLEQTRLIRQMSSSTKNQ